MQSPLSFELGRQCERKFIDLLGAWATTTSEVRCRLAHIHYCHSRHREGRLSHIHLSGLSAGCRDLSLARKSPIRILVTQTFSALMLIQKLTVSCLIIAPVILCDTARYVSSVKHIVSVDS